MILSYSYWKELFEQQTQPTSIVPEIKFGFKFDSGKYLRSEISEEKLNKLYTDLRPMVNELAFPKYLGGQTIVKIIASTSTLPLSKDLKEKLKKEGFESKAQSGNDSLCAARLKTMEDTIVEYFAQKLSITKEEVLGKIKVEREMRPDSGTKEENATEDSRKNLQWMAVSLQQTGTLIPTPQIIQCDTRDQMFNGTAATAENNYVGYSSDLLVKVPPGKKITISFNPIDVPDMFYARYKDTEILTPFLGVANLFDKELNDSTKYPDLAQKINAELESIDSSKRVQLVNGKIQIQPGPKQGGNPGSYQITIDKKFEIDKLTIRVFSPLKNTQFSVSSKCS